LEANVTITNGYCSLAQLKAEMRIGTSDTADDTRLELSIAAASRQIDAHTGRRFWQDSALKMREFYADDPLTCFTDDISTTDGLIVQADEAEDGTYSETLTLNTNFILLPVNAADNVPAHPFTQLRIVNTDNYSGFPWRVLRPGVRVTAKFGWPAIPDDITKAALIQSSQLFKASDAVFGAAQFGEAGVALRVQARLNPMAEALLETYCHPKVA
jgi:hypothetical protein